MFRVRELRKAAGLSQEQLAVKAGVTSRTIQLIEGGRDAKASTLLAIAGVLGVPIADIFGEKAS